MSLDAATGLTEEPANLLEVTGPTPSIRATPLPNPLAPSLPAPLVTLASTASRRHPAGSHEPFRLPHLSLLLGRLRIRLDDLCLQ
jgi:hypothetical protein